MDLGRTYCFLGEYLKWLEYPDFAKNTLSEYMDALIHANINPIKSIFLPGNRTKQNRKFVKH
jgi:hypothetical protein